MPTPASTVQSERKQVEEFIIRAEACELIGFEEMARLYREIVDACDHKVSLLRTLETHLLDHKIKSSKRREDIEEWKRENLPGEAQ